MGVTKCVPQPMSGPVRCATDNYRRLWQTVHDLQSVGSHICTMLNVVFNELDALCGGCATVSCRCFTSSRKTINVYLRHRGWWNFLAVTNVGWCFNFTTDDLRTCSSRGSCACVIQLSGNLVASCSLVQSLWPLVQWSTLKCVGRWQSFGNIFRDAYHICPRGS